MHGSVTSQIQTSKCNRQDTQPAVSVLYTYIICSSYTLDNCDHSVSECVYVCVCIHIFLNQFLVANRTL